MAINLIIDADAPNQDGLLDGFNSTGQAQQREFVRGDKQLAITIRPVVTNENESANSSRPWMDDYEDGDSFQVAIGLTDQPPTDGAFTLALGGDTGGLIDIPYNVTATDLANALQNATTNFGDVYGVLLENGVYEMRWANNQYVPPVTSPSNTLRPQSHVSVVVQNPGDDDSGAVQIISLRQDPVAYAEPDTEFPDATVSADIKQVGSGTQNKIYTITTNAYDGGFSLSYTPVTGSAATAGTFTPDSTVADYTSALEALTAVGDFAVSKTGGTVTIEMRGTQKLSNTPVIAVTNINLVAPKGVSGIINLNTINLYRYFYGRTDQQATFLMEVRRSRVTGEERTIYQAPVTLKRNLIDVGTMIAVDGYSSYSAGQYPYKEKTTSYTLSSVDYAVNFTGTTATATLPSADGAAGRTYVIKNTGTLGMTISPSGGDLIDGSIYADLDVGASITLMSTGSDWIII